MIRSFRLYIPKIQEFCTLSFSVMRRRISAARSQLKIPQ
jgi:hypothetical protein